MCVDADTTEHVAFYVSVYELASLSRQVTGTSAMGSLCLCLRPPTIKTDRQHKQGKGNLTLETEIGGGDVFTPGGKTLRQSTVPVIRIEHDIIFKSRFLFYLETRPLEIAP